MKQPQHPSKDRLPQNDYWMRAISFAGFHRLLKAVAVFPNGLRAGELNELVQEKGIWLTRHGSGPAPTTLYHYRNALLHRRALLGVVSPPNDLTEKTMALLNDHKTGHGVKAAIVRDEYGIGKTYLLQWLHVLKEEESNVSCRANY